MQKKLDKNRELLEQTNKRAEELRSFVASQDAKARTIQQELGALTSMEPVEDEEEQLLRQLADLRAWQLASRTVGC